MPSVSVLLKPTAAELRKFPREREIRLSIQNKILTGKLPAGTALPSAKELARLWKSNYFTVYQALTPLVREGLLIRQKGLGTQVASTRRKLQTVGVYYGTDIITKPQHGYAVQLHRLLHQSLTREGLKMRTWLDPRESDESVEEILPDITWGVEHQHIQGVVALMTQPEHVAMFDRLGVPVVYFGRGAGAQRVHLPRREFLTRALLAAKARGARKIALIASPEVLVTDERSRIWNLARSREVFANLCKANGVTTAPGWIHLVDSGAITAEKERAAIDAGYQSCFAKKGERPDALVVYPDNNLATLWALLVSRGEQLDERLLVISHRNEPLAFPLPVGPHYIALSLKSVADGLVQALLDCAAGRECGIRAAELIESDVPGAVPV